jgi:formiminotetrahydrofolate cyclodeaminase
VGKKRYEDVQDQVETIAASAEALRLQLLDAIRADVAAFEQVMAAYAISKDDPGRADAIRRATYGAADVPLSVARAALAALKLAGQAAAIGNKNAISDALAGVHMGLAAVEIAALNVKINVSGDESPAAVQYRADITAVVEEARRAAADLLAQGTSRAGL